MGLLVRAVEDHEGLAFDALDLDPDSKQAVLSRSGTPQDPDVRGAVLSMLHLGTEMKTLLQPAVRPD